MTEKKYVSKPSCCHGGTFNDGVYDEKTGKSGLICGVCGKTTWLGFNKNIYSIEDLEEYYKMGFKDGWGERPHWAESYEYKEDMKRYWEGTKEEMDL